MKVAVAIIFDQENRILITKRPLHVSHGGQWEFPGGKLEDGETPFAALVREIKEEVGIDILEAQFLTDINHTYGLKTVTLLFYCVFKFQGTAVCSEAQIDLRWVEPGNLANYDFPEANNQIIKLLGRELSSDLKNAFVQNNL